MFIDYADINFLIFIFFCGVGFYLLWILGVLR